MGGASSSPAPLGWSCIGRSVLSVPRSRLFHQRGATQEGLAYEAGITTGTLSQLERGISNPSWGTLKAIAGALGISMVELAKLTAKLER